MPDCDYCGESFGDEGAYLDHLAAVHEGELGSIDERRVAERDADAGGSVPLGPAVLVALLVAAGGLVVYVTFLMGGSGDTAAAKSLPDHGADAVVSQVRTEESSGRGHVPQGTDVKYERVPPTSGTHWGGSWERAGFYTEPKRLESLLHSLEHGAVVVYYDPARITPDARADLRAWADRQTGDWQSFIAVPNPKDDPESAYVLTAWEKRLPMDTYDDDAVGAFVAEYVGRGPERPVR